MLYLHADVPANNSLEAALGLVHRSIVLHGDEGPQKLLPNMLHLLQAPDALTACNMTIKLNYHCCKAQL